MPRRRIALTPAQPDSGFEGWVEVSAQWFPFHILETIAPHVKSGDIVLFSGSTKYGRFIKASTHSEWWSHVGMIWRCWSRARIEVSSPIVTQARSIGGSRRLDCSTRCLPGPSLAAFHSRPAPAVTCPSADPQCLQLLNNKLLYQPQVYSSFYDRVAE
jgi:hypothetical protein